MFDDPKKALQRLQDELLAAEEPEEEWDEEDSEGEDDPDAALDEMRDLLTREDWEETRREPLYRSYAPEAEEEAEEEDPQEKPLPRKSKPAARKEKGIGGLVVALILETLALLAVFAWWLLW